MGEFFAGLVSGMVGLAVGHPVDTIKVQQQNLGIGIVQCIKNIQQIDGLRGYFRGLSFPLLGSGVLNSIYFGAYGQTLNLIIKHREYEAHTHSKFAKPTEVNPIRAGKATYLDIYMAGCAGGVAQLGLACPVDLIKVKLQAGGLKAGRPTDAVRKIIQERGLRGLYQGIGIMAFRDIPAFGLYVTMYEFFMDELKELSDGLDIDFGGNFSAHLSNSSLAFLAGGMAGTISWWSIIPLDVLKSRIQADDPAAPKYRGILDCADKVVAQHGIRGFFRGFVPLSIRAYVCNGAIFLTYEWIQLLWNRVTRRRKPQGYS